MHERFNNAEAANLFNEALERDPKNAQAYLGLALVSADGFDSKAVEYARKALELDPKLVEAHELMASLRSKIPTGAKRSSEADAALKISPEALDAMAIHAAVELLADRSPDAWLEKIRQVNPVYGEGYALVAHHLVLNRRYEEGVAYYRKAIEARSAAVVGALAARHQPDAPRAGRRAAQAARDVLQQRLSATRRRSTACACSTATRTSSTFKDDNTILKLDKKEADLLRPYFEDGAEARHRHLREEIQDDAARPGAGRGLSGSRGLRRAHHGHAGPRRARRHLRRRSSPWTARRAASPASFNWASTLWHEMNHVFILTATNHRVPRWFAEGLAVHEETEVSPEWGDRLTPDVVVAH